MSEAINSVAAEVAPKARKANKPKKAAKPNQPTKAAREVGVTDKSVGERRLMVIKVLRRGKATSAMTAMTATAVAAKSGLTRFDAYGQLYHTHFLQQAGFVKQVKLEGSRELSFFLTAKGDKATDDVVKAG